MELEQPDVTQPEGSRNDKAETKPAKKHRKRTHRAPVVHDKSSPKSLSESWAETIERKNDKTVEDKKSTDKKGDTEPQTTRAVHELHEEEAIELHPIEAHEIHERVQEGRDEDAGGIDKKDPVWEPWKPPVEAEKAVKDLATPVAEQRASVESAEVAPDEKPEASQPAQPVEIVPPPSFTQQSVNPNTTTVQAFRAEAFTVSAPSQLPEYRNDLPQEAQEIMDQLHAGNEHHLEQSSWHNIEVDDKTGKAVEPAGFNYGEAFQQEQRPESAQFTHGHDEEAEEVAAASGQLAVGLDESPAMLEPPEERQTEESPLRQDSIRQTKPLPILPRNSLADPVLWIILIVIVIAIIFAVVL